MARLLTEREHLEMELYHHWFEDGFKEELSQDLPFSQTYSSKHFQRIGDIPAFQEDLDILQQILAIEEAQLLKGVNRDGTPLKDGTRFIAGSIEYAWDERENKACACRTLRTPQEQQAMYNFIRGPQRISHKDPSRCKKRESLEGRTIFACKYKGRCINQYGGTINAGQNTRYLCKGH